MCNEKVNGNVEHRATSNKIKIARSNRIIHTCVHFKPAQSPFKCITHLSVMRSMRCRRNLKNNREHPWRKEKRKCSMLIFLEIKMYRLIYRITDPNVYSSFKKRTVKAKI